MTYTNKAYVEHVAVRVKNIHWHIQFFYEVLGMDVREIDGPTDSPHQYWTLGGIQLMSAPDQVAPAMNETTWVGHIGVMVDDLEAALTEAYKRDIPALPQGRNWLQLPDGIVVELIQAAPGTVAQALSVNPRATKRKL